MGQKSEDDTVPFYTQYLVQPGETREYVLLCTYSYVLRVRESCDKMKTLVIWILGRCMAPPIRQASIIQQSSKWFTPAKLYVFMPQIFIYNLQRLSPDSTKARFTLNSKLTVEHNFTIKTFQ